jgi:hypothetical protein
MFRMPRLLAESRLAVLYDAFNYTHTGPSDTLLFSSQLHPDQARPAPTVMRLTHARQRISPLHSTNAPQRGLPPLKTVFSGMYG